MDKFIYNYSYIRNLPSLYVHLKYWQSYSQWNYFPMQQKIAGKIHADPHLRSKASIAAWCGVNVKSVAGKYDDDVEYYATQFTELDAASYSLFVGLLDKQPAKTRNGLAKVFLYLCQNIKACGTWSHPEKLIADELDMHWSTIQRYVQILANAGFITYRGGFTANSRKYKLAANFYTEYELQKYFQ